MLFGQFGTNIDQSLVPQRIDGGVEDHGDSWSLLLRPWRGETAEHRGRFHSDATSGSWIAYTGRPLSGSDDSNQVCTAVDIFKTLRQHGMQGLRRLRGTFAIVWFDAAAQKVHFIRDHFGIETLYYRSMKDSVLCASRASQLGQLGSAELAPLSIRDYLLYSYLPGHRTLFEGTVAVPPGAAVSVDLANLEVAEAKWYRLSYAADLYSEQESVERFRECLFSAVRRQVGGGRIGCMISGGMDSSAVLSIIGQSAAAPDKISTFGFRCPGPSFDESVYARQLASHWQTQHSEILFGLDEALRISDAVREMDNPFSDIGIELGTWSVASAATGSVDYMLTGDGGDEIWASHPVYAAQRLVKYYDSLPIPAGLKRKIFAALQRIPDSSKKRDFRVIAKRLLPSPELPEALRHFRWRVVMPPSEIRACLRPDAVDWVLQGDTYDACTYAFDGFDGPDDGMSDMLFNDYYTASSFYFRRLDFYRHYGIEPRMPFFDVDLVEAGARIPAKLKLEGIEKTKRLFRTAMRGTVPDFILDRKDKLGHSVPLKNWIREKGPLRDMLYDTLLSSAMLNRGIFDRSAIQRWQNDHDQGRHNYSHRLWSVFVLELWLQSHAAGFTRKDEQGAEGAGRQAV